MEASSLCDQLKDKIDYLETELARLRAAQSTFNSLSRVANGVVCDTGGSKSGHGAEWDLRNVVERFQALRVQASELAQQRDEARNRADDLDKQRGEERKRADDNAYELQEYHKKYQELNKAAQEALAHVGLGVQPAEYTVQATILAALDRLSEAAHNDTVDSRLKRLENACYQAESRSGCMCKEQNPWARVEWVLNQMSCEVTRLKHAQSVYERVKQRVWQIQRNLDARADRAVRSETDAEEVLYVLDLIEEKAMEAYNVRAACVKLKELL